MCARLAPTGSEDKRSVACPQGQAPVCLVRPSRNMGVCPARHFLALRGFWRRFRTPPAGIGEEPPDRANRPKENAPCKSSLRILTIGIKCDHNQTVTKQEAYRTWTAVTRVSVDRALPVGRAAKDRRVLQ